MPSIDPVHFPPESYFSCTSCGKCCRHEWNVAVTEEKAEKLADLKCFKKLSKDGFVPLPVVNGTRLIGRHEDGNCLFHSDQGCAIHSEVGASEKPETCQIYPFSLVNTPDGYFASLLFSCPAAMAGRGEPISEAEPDLARMLSSFSVFEQPPASSTVTIHENYRMSWTDYVKLEPHLLNSLRMEDPAEELVNLAVRLGYLSDGNPDIEKAVSCPSLLEQALELLPLFACHAISVVENPNNPEERSSFVEALFSGQSQPSRLIPGHLPPFQRRSIPSLLTKQILTRYLRGFIFGKRLLLGPTLVTRLLLLATAVSIFLYYSEALFEKGNRTLESEGASLEFAFDLIETNFLTRSEDIKELFLEYERVIGKYREMSHSPTDKT
jgi:Fe-S-cluster containining protein